MDKGVQEQLNRASKMLGDAEKAQKMAYSQLRSYVSAVPQEHREVINNLMAKVSKLEKEQDPEMAQNLQDEVNELIRKQRKDAS